MSDFRDAMTFAGENLCKGFYDMAHQEFTFALSIAKNPKEKKFASKNLNRLDIFLIRKKIKISK